MRYWPILRGVGKMNFPQLTRLIQRGLAIAGIGRFPRRLEGWGALSISGGWLCYWGAGFAAEM